MPTESSPVVSAPVAAPVAEPTVKAKAKAPVPAPLPFIALLQSLPAPVASPKGAFDAAVAWGSANGFPTAGIRRIRDEILSRVPHLTGKVKWTTGGTALSAKAALKAAAAEVAKYHAKDDDADAYKAASERLASLLAILAALAGDKTTDVNL